ncbi:unnamed protein product [Adineta steineri]|uniref:Uncharacterized protein n=1 Tax=Adineta steineri TaxID=433720 RepID=A0A820B5H0_9BILA|nr:unnamed protein product [Adineta steineri]CAF4195752.1 unnamed protein product [Adineta steineri]
MIIIEYDSDSDSLELINPVTNLSLEHFDKNKSSQAADDQAKQLQKLQLNDSNKKDIEHKSKPNIISSSRCHRYQPYQYSYLVILL